MSEIINNSKMRIETLKKLILKLHENENVEETQKELSELMGSVPYGEVVQAEQQLIDEGMDKEEIVKHCDLHSEALKGKIEGVNFSDLPNGHPVDVFLKENLEIKKVIEQVRDLFKKNSERDSNEDSNDILVSLNALFNSLMDIEKHYMRKENLVFPYLEKNDITGPPMVMWGKDDEIRGLLKSCFPLFKEHEEAISENVQGFVELMFEPTLKSIEEMIYKEENILFPMCLDTLTDIEWYQIQEQSDEIGFCLYYPEIEWQPEFADKQEVKSEDDKRIKFSTGSFSNEELECMINSLPLDITFVDKDDKVKYFSHGTDRIFQRQKSILGRQVQFCHPPSSVHIVNQIVDDFKSGKQDSAKFWINFQGKFVHIAYYAVRNEKGEYLGTAELSQDIAEYRSLDGERRILQYDK